MGRARARGALAAAAAALALALAGRAPPAARADGLAPEDMSAADLDALVSSIQMVSALPFPVQREILKGAVASVLPADACNPLGGADECKPLRTTAAFDAMCPSMTSAAVDCAFYSSSERDVQDDLEERVYAGMRDRGYEECQDCLGYQKALYCALAAPACGSVDRMVEWEDADGTPRGLLPAVEALVADAQGAELAEAEGAQAFALAALQRVVPEAVDGLMLGMPCREMCEAAVDSCACGDASPTVGELLARAHGDDLDVTGMTLAAELAIFEPLYSRPLCELFAPRDAPGFAGVCEVSAPAAPCGYCSQGGVEPPSELQEMIAAELFAMVNDLVEGSDLGKALSEDYIDAAYSAAEGAVDYAYGDIELDYEVKESLAPIKDDEDEKRSQASPPPRAASPPPPPPPIVRKESPPPPGAAAASPPPPQSGHGGDGDHHRRAGTAGTAIITGTAAVAAARRPPCC